jgi:hypothetical protein
MRRTAYGIIAVLAVEVFAVWFLSYRTTIDLTATNGSRAVFEFHADDGSFWIANANSRLRSMPLLLPLLVVLLWPIVEAALVLRHYVPKKAKATKTEATPAAEESPALVVKTSAPASPSAGLAAVAAARSTGSPSAASPSSVKSPATAAADPRPRPAVARAAQGQPAAPAPAATPARPASPAAPSSQAAHK